jgi:hypothetical protein
MKTYLKPEPSNMAGLNEQFAKTGLIAVSSISIVRDCARLLLDLYRTGIQLQILTVLNESEQALGVAMSLLSEDKTAQQGLVMLSDMVAADLYRSSLLNRRNISNLYDFSKHLQSFHQLLANDDLQSLLRKVLSTQELMLHKDSVGMRFDLPNETAQLTELHQEFHSFPFGLNGAVLWVPLTRISRFHGTLAYYPRPHLSNPLPFEGDASEQDRLLAEGRLQEAQKAGRLKASAEELGVMQYLDAEPGQCYIFSAVLPHASVSAGSSAEIVRLTCQARFFDIYDPFLAWKHRTGSMFDGLKQPLVGWRKWKEYSNG